MAKQKKETEEKKQGYQAGDALKGTLPELNDINFRNKDVMRWTDMTAGRQRQTPIQVQGLATLSNKTKLPRYNKK